MYVVVYLHGLDDESSRSNHLLSTQIARRFPVVLCLCTESQGVRSDNAPSSLKSAPAFVFQHMEPALVSSHVNTTELKSHDWSYVKCHV